MSVFLFSLSFNLKIKQRLEVAFLRKRTANRQSGEIDDAHESHASEKSEQKTQI